MSFLPSVRRTRASVRAVRAASDAVLEKLENRQLLSTVVIWSENFNGLAYGPNVEETLAGTNVWTKVPPAGWTKDDTGVPGWDNPPANNGITEWIGWTFADSDWWAAAAGDQTRTQFSNNPGDPTPGEGRATGGIMIADNDEWDDADHPGKPTYAGLEGQFDAVITTSPISLGSAARNSLVLDLDSSWRPEGFDDGERTNNQTAIIEAVFPDGTSRELIHWDSDPLGEFFHPDSQNEHLTLPLGDIPAGATSFQLRFKQERAANDWWWAVDNLVVRGNVPFTQPTLIGITGNQGGDLAANDETLWEIGFATGPTTDVRYLDGFEDITGNPPDTILTAVNNFGVSEGAYSLRVEVPQTPTPFWGIRSPNVVDLIRGGASQLAYELTLNGRELNGGSFAGADNSFNGFAQSNELAVVINTPSGGFIQRNFITGNAVDSLGTNATWSGTDGTRTITWDLTTFTAADGTSLKDFVIANNATDARFWFVTQGSDSNGNQGPMRFYFDNFRVTLPPGDTLIGDFETLSVSKIIKLPFIPDTDAIGFNPESGLLHHTSGGSSYSNNITNNGYRDNHFMETVDVLSGSNALVPIFNANPEQFGPVAPRPTWVLPATRRTDEQNTDEFKDMKGPGEYHAARDLVWSTTHRAFFIADEDGIYRLTANGATSTFVGDPGIPQGGAKGIAFITVEGRRRLIVSQRDGPNLYTIDPETGQIVGEPVAMTDAEGNPLVGVLSLVETPEGVLIGIAKDPAAPNDFLARQLIRIDPVTGATSKLGVFTGLHMADLAYVVPGATPRVSEVYVRGSTWSNNFKTLLETRTLGDDVLGYRTDNQPATNVLPWTNMDEVVVRFTAPPTGSGVPTVGMVLDGARSDYTVTSVTTIDPQTYVLRLNRPLGNLPTGGENGDRVVLSIPGGGAGGAAYTTTLTVVQGDVNKSGSVLANDYSEVKARFFQNTTQPAYSPFHDVDGSGSVLANDYSAVKSRFFDNLPPPAPAGAAAGASITASLFGTKKILG